MLGYVTAEKPELKMKEYEVYSAYYCGICKSTGKRHGQVNRLALNYDFAFLAILLDGLFHEQNNIQQEHCIVHPVKKKNVVKENQSVNYAADMMQLLVYYNFKDDIRDEGGLLSSLGAAFFHHTFKKLRQKYGMICKIIEEQLDILYKLEQEKSPSLDETGEAFAAIMKVLCTSFSPLEENESFEETKLLLAHLGRYLGKWIYLIDAWDDIDKDISSSSYNPLLYRFEYNQNETVADFRNRIKDTVEFNLLNYLAEIGKAYDLLPIKKNEGLLENIIYMGLLRKSEELLKKGTE